MGSVAASQNEDILIFERFEVALQFVVIILIKAQLQNWNIRLWIEMHKNRPYAMIESPLIGKLDQLRPVGSR